MPDYDKLAEYEQRQGRMSEIAELLADEYGGDSSEWEDIAYMILERLERTGNG